MNFAVLSLFDVRFLMYILTKMNLLYNVFSSWITILVICKSRMLLQIKMGFNKMFPKDFNIVKIILSPFNQLWKSTEGESIIYVMNSF